MSDQTIYIGKIVEMYITGNGNYFCREDGKSIDERPIDWPIFIPKDVGDRIETLPVYGIITIEKNPWFFNGESRLTCRQISDDRKVIEQQLYDSLNFNDSIDREVEKIINDFKKKYGV